MTNEEALKHFKSLQKRYITEHNGVMCEKVEVAIEAIEKQIPKKPNYVQYDGNPKIGNYHCPVCEKILELEPIDHNEKVFCLHCGQAIDWSD